MMQRINKLKKVHGMHSNWRAQRQIGSQVGKLLQSMQLIQDAGQNITNHLSTHKDSSFSSSFESQRYSVFECQEPASGHRKKQNVEIEEGRENMDKDQMLNSKLGILASSRAKQDSR